MNRSSLDIILLLVGVAVALVPTVLGVTGFITYVAVVAGIMIAAFSTEIANNIAGGKN